MQMHHNKHLKLETKAKTWTVFEGLKTKQVYIFHAQLTF